MHGIVTRPHHSLKRCSIRLGMGAVQMPPKGAGEGLEPLRGLGDLRLQKRRLVGCLEGLLPMLGVPGQERGDRSVLRLPRREPGIERCIAFPDGPQEMIGEQPKDGIECQPS